MSGKPIKLKDLIDVHFTHIKDRDTKTAIISKQVLLYLSRVPRKHVFGVFDQIENKLSCTDRGLKFEPRCEKTGLRGF